MTWASKIDAAGDQADMAKTIENCWFSVFFEGWAGDSGGLKCSWLSFWGTDWLKGGWLKGCLVVAGVGLDAGWGVGWPRGLLALWGPCQVRLSR